MVRCVWGGVCGEVCVGRCVCVGEGVSPTLQIGHHGQLLSFQYRYHSVGNT